MKLTQENYCLKIVAILAKKNPSLIIQSGFGLYEGVGALHITLHKETFENLVASHLFHLSEDRKLSKFNEETKEWLLINSLDFL